VKALVVILFLASLVAAIVTVGSLLFGSASTFAGRLTAVLLLWWVTLAAVIALSGSNRC